MILSNLKAVYHLKVRGIQYRYSVLFNWKSLAYISTWEKYCESSLHSFIYLFCIKRLVRFSEW